ncbi:hypothetical protein ACJX0J_027918, partial [Zea mays]
LCSEPLHFILSLNLFSEQMTFALYQRFVAATAFLMQAVVRDGFFVIFFYKVVKHLLLKKYYDIFTM